MAMSLPRPYRALTAPLTSLYMELLPGSFYVSAKSTGGVGWFMVCLRHHAGFVVTCEKTIQVLEGRKVTTHVRWLDDVRNIEAVL